MSVIELLLILLVLGFVLYYMNTLPIAQPIRLLIGFVLVVLAVVMVVNFFGWWDLGDNWHHHHYHQ